MNRRTHGHERGNHFIVSRSLVGILLVLGIALTGCRTAQGIGQDLKAAGRAIENAAR